MDTVTLISSDNREFVVDRSIANLAATTRNLLEDISDDPKIPLPNVKAKDLEHIIELSTLYDAADDEGSKAKVTERAEKLDRTILFDVLLAAYYLDMPMIVDAIVTVVVGLIKGRTPDEIRKTFNVENDWDPEEYAKIRKEHAWAFDD